MGKFIVRHEPFGESKIHRKEFRLETEAMGYAVLLTESGLTRIVVEEFREEQGHGIWHAIWKPPTLSASLGMPAFAV